MALGEQEKRGLVQLGVCVVIFLTVFVGRGVFPVETEPLRENLLDILRQDTDFQAVFSYLGWAVAEEAPVLETLDDIWVEMFGGESETVLGVNRETSVGLKEEGRVEVELLKLWTHTPPNRPSVPPAPAKPPTPAQRDLGLTETMTPVMGVLSSPFGDREHPINGGIKHHNGIDLAAEEGTEILAFADGVVDFIGEEKTGYGLYIQLDHGNGIKTFYAHCSELCAQKGQVVRRGDVIAKVGNTGNSTSSHLHLEVKKDGQLLDPQPYVEYALP